MVLERLAALGGAPRAGIAQARAAPGRQSLGLLGHKALADPAARLARIEPASELADAELMVEALGEDVAVKRELFARAGRAKSGRGSTPTTVEGALCGATGARLGAPAAPTAAGLP